jgi:hypothetical protein
LTGSPGRLKVTTAMPVSMMVSKAGPVEDVEGLESRVEVKDDLRLPKMCCAGW